MQAWHRNVPGTVIIPLAIVCCSIRITDDVLLHTWQAPGVAGAVSNDFEAGEAGVAAATGAAGAAGAGPASNTGSAATQKTGANSWSDWVCS